MTAGTTEIGNERRTSSVAWVATAIGAGLGVAAFAYSQRRRSPWARAKDRAGDLIDTARQQAKPWMSVAAGTAAAGGALAIYARNRKQSGWQRAGRRASEIASRFATKSGRWTNLAALAWASAALGNNARRRTIRGVDERTSEAANALAERGMQI